MIVHGNYLIETIEYIDSGTFGDVEKILLKNQTGKECGYCARKILKGQDDDPTLLARFKREVKAQDNCLHKNVVQIFICSMHTNPAWFVMDLAEATLKDEMDAGILTNEQKINIILMITRGVAWIHSKGYLHRDIKPQNILKFPNGVYKISDFGLARHMDPNEASTILTQIGQFPRTPKYFDHGVVLHGYSKQSDLFSIGIIIEEMEISGFEGIVDKCTDRRLHKRYQSAEQLIADIKKISGEL
ncbi:protein kinase domain-containing protein [Proteus terrae]|uniref:protein kinase domain-containing protein n=1 Tax=Proteus terrae TaxID=1574161 RepID=UPI0018C76E89|nr:protein kinase [Proteus terrae]MBG2839198.1 protein kinase [Proteus terrae subsp. cibarius]MBG2870347.1 protein kinase [Proteus terrae subsp. cibarius]MCS6716007.1 protein kinase [Proteus terrae]MCS6733387.1 protein kinase [Proteus terrae]